MAAISIQGFGDISPKSLYLSSERPVLFGRLAYYRIHRTL